MDLEYDSVKSSVTENKTKLKEPVKKGGILLPLPDIIEDLYTQISILNERLNKIEKQ